MAQLRRLLLTLTALSLTALALASMFNPASAAGGDFASVTGTGNGTCNSTSFTVPLLLKFKFSTDFNTIRIHTVNGNVIFSNEANTPGPLSGANVAPIHSDGGYSVSGSYRFSVYYEYLESGISISASTVNYTCLNGIAYLNGLAANGTAFVGPSVPVGFDMKTVTCTTAVFDGPGGNPVPGAVVKAGQTWFVGPKPENDTKGRAWTEIFVGGYSDGYIWSSCLTN